LGVGQVRVLTVVPAHGSRECDHLDPPGARTLERAGRSIDGGATRVDVVDEDDSGRRILRFEGIADVRAPLGERKATLAATYAAGE
jgi:hypothetical protein